MATDFPELPAERNGAYVAWSGYEEDNTVCLDGDFTFKDIEILYKWLVEKRGSQ